MDRFDLFYKEMSHNLGRPLMNNELFFLKWLYERHEKESLSVK